MQTISLRVLVAVLALMAAGSVAAEWLDHDELPEWARRGYVRWGHGGNVEGRMRYRHDRLGSYARP